MVGFLKKYICANTGFVQFTIIFDTGCGNIDINAANGAVFVFDAVNSFDAFQNIIQWIIYRVFTCFQSQALMSHILKCDNFAADFILSEFFSGDVFVYTVIRAINAAVNTVV